jgi:transposase-like protein
VFSLTTQLCIDGPEKITIDKSGANTAAIESVKADACVDILMCQNKWRSALFTA